MLLNEKTKHAKPIKKQTARPVWTLIAIILTIWQQLNGCISSPFTLTFDTKSSSNTTSFFSCTTTCYCCITTYTTNSPLFSSPVILIICSNALSNWHCFYCCLTRPESLLICDNFTPIINWRDCNSFNSFLATNSSLAHCGSFCWHKILINLLYSVLELSKLSISLFFLASTNKSRSFLFVDISDGKKEKKTKSSYTARAKPKHITPSLTTLVEHKPKHDEALTWK